MKLTGKCKTDFDKWLKEHIIFCTVDDVIFWFYEQPSMMQYGVYVDFFDSVGIYFDIEVDKNRKDEIAFFVMPSIWKDSFNEYKTRQEAREQAIEKANEIYNKL